MILEFVAFSTCLLLGFFVLWLHQFNFYYQRLKKIPSPRVWPLIGNALEFRFGKDTLYTYERLMKDNNTKTLRLHIGNRNAVITKDCKFVELLLSSNRLISKSMIYDYVKPWLGEGLVTSTGQHWRNHRKMLTPTFHFQILEKFLDTFHCNVTILMSKLQTHVGEPSVNVFPYMTLCTLDIICETAMGISINAQLESDSEYVRCVKEMGRILRARTFNPLLANNFIYKWSQTYKVEEHCLKVLHGFTDSVLKAKRKALGQTTKKHYDELSKKKNIPFLDMLLHITIDGKPLTDIEIRDEVTTFLFAGHETTAVANSFILYNLANNPIKQQKAFEEQVSIFGEDKNRQCTLADLQAMKYLDLVIKESLRLYPSAPFYGRRVMDEFTYDGITFPKGTNIGILAFTMHRDPEYFQNPEVFEPERFLPENHNGRKPFTYVPFSAGPRNCIGQKYAIMEIKTIIGQILRHFELKPATPHHKLRLAADFILHSDNGMNIAIAERQY